MEPRNYTLAESTQLRELPLGVHITLSLLIATHSPLHTLRRHMSKSSSGLNPNNAEASALESADGALRSLLEGLVTEHPALLHHHLLFLNPFP